MIRLMVALLIFFGGDGEYGFSTVVVGAILGNERGIQSKIILHYSQGVKWQQGFMTGIGF